MKTKRSLFVIVAVMAMTVPGVVAMAGEATSEAFPSSAGSYGALRLAAGDAGAGAFSDGNWNDPSEYYAAIQREARAKAGGTLWTYAGSYVTLRLAASDAAADAVSAGNWNDPSEYYAAVQREISAAAKSETCEVC